MKEESCLTPHGARNAAGGFSKGASRPYNGMSKVIVLMICLRQFFATRATRLSVGLVTVLLAVLLTGRAMALPNADLGPAPVQKLNEMSVGAFADKEIPAAMREGKIPGAVFVVVRDGQVVCEKAYGVADLNTRQPVSTGRTLFRVASISKILTTAAALQLVQAHRLGLHQNINAYLTRFQIAPAFGEPITLANLLTHASGFDTSHLGYAARSAAGRLSLRDYVTEYQPARVRPPGLFSVYDNYGFALAGYLVQKAAGIPFAKYVQDRILGPLDMTDSSFSPDAAQRKRLATGYWLDNEQPRACGRSYINITPAAGLCTTATDMSDFLIALLTDRRPDGSSLFPTSVIRGLETQQFDSSPEVPGRCYGFDRITIAGRRALRQTGQWPGFNSVLMLFPKQHCGLFLAYNLCDYLRMEQRITRRFAEKFIPPEVPDAAPLARPESPAEDSLAPLLGSYLSARAPHETPTLEFPPEIEVSQLPDGNLEIHGKAYREIGPLVFEHIETNRLAGAVAGQRVAFRLGRDGRVADLITQSAAYRRVNWWESNRGWVVLMRVATIAFISALVLWPVMALMRLAFAGAPKKTGPRSPRRRASFSLLARGVAFAACGLALWFELSMAVAELRLKPFAEFYGIPASVKQLLWVLPVLMGFTAVLMGFAVIVWCRRIWHPVHRLHYLLLAVALGLFLYTFYSRHLLFAGLRLSGGHA